MCTVCGCGGDGATIEAGKGHRHGHDHGHGHDHPHAHGQGHTHDHDHHPAPGGPQGDLHFGRGPAHAHAPGLSQARMIQIETDILAKNDAYAAENREAWTARGVLALNLMSSPGSGKTTLLVRTIEAMGAAGVAVIEGDQQTSNDADRIRATGAPAVQVNTGKGCHLDAHMVGHAAEHLPLPPGAVLFIENVGNLVCPAAFDLGEDARVAILSVTEGEDKPLKYPDIFAGADLVIVTKTDLALHCGVDLAAIAENVARISPEAALLHLSARSGEGMAAWLDWIAARRDRAIRARLAALEAERAALRRMVGA